ncbi:hypothetical protein D9M71_718810 [compost metagenome]
MKKCRPRLSQNGERPFSSDMPRISAMILLPNNSGNSAMNSMRALDKRRPLRPVRASLRRNNEHNSELPVRSLARNSVGISR